MEIYVGNNQLTRSREDIVNFIMASHSSHDELFDFPWSLDQEDVQNAIDTVKDLASVDEQPRKRRRSTPGGKKRGPQISKARIKLYHLPPAANIPKKLSYEDPDVKRHMDNGYGYTERFFDSKGPRVDSLLVNDDEDGFTNYIHQCLPNLNSEPFYLYKLSPGRKFSLLSVKNSRQLRAEQYQGTIFAYSSTNGHHPNAVISTVVDDNVDSDELQHDFEKARDELLGKFGNDTQEILVNRRNLVEKSLEVYMDPSIMSCKLYVSFENEEADDFAGVTRDFFSQFWNGFLKKHSHGYNENNLTQTPHNVYPDNVYKAIGRILIHGFVISGYLPIRMNLATLSILTNRQPSDVLKKESFLRSLNPNDREFLESMMNSSSFTMDDKVKISTIFSIYNINGVPSNSIELGQTIKEISTFVSLISPSYMINEMKLHDPILCRLTETEFMKYVNSIRATGDTVATSIQEPEYSSDPMSRCMEERSFGYCSRYIQSLNSKLCEKKLKFVTGHEVLTGKIGILFNGESNPELMAPKGHTCGMQLELSRFFSSYEQFSSIMTNVLNNPAVSDSFHFS